jgi:HK97 family phage prohead protease
MFMPGAFTRQLSTPGRDKVLLNFEHEVGIRGVIGQSLSFRERDDGLYGSFGVHENTDGDKALEMINTGLLTGLSAEFRPTRGGSRRVDGVVQRLRAQLDKVSLCRYPAYQAAQVLAVREEPDDPPPPEFAFDRSTDVDQRLAALGFERLKRAATTSKPWDGSPARFTDEQYRASALFCRGGDGPVKELCSLPVKEPDGTVNVNALGSAAAALAGARGGVRNVPREQKTQAARKLIRLYGMANLDPPPALVALARS